MILWNDVQTDDRLTASDLRTMWREGAWLDTQIRQLENPKCPYAVRPQYVHRSDIPISLRRKYVPCKNAVHEGNISCTAHGGTPKPKRIRVKREYSCPHRQVLADKEKFTLACEQCGAIWIRSAAISNGD